MSPCLRCTRSVGSDCSRVGVGCGRLVPRSSAPVRHTLATEPLTAAGQPVFVSSPCRAPLPNPPRAPVCASKSLGSRTSCWRAAPAFCARVEGECRLRPSNPLPKEGLESVGFCWHIPPLPLRRPAPVVRESELPFSCSRSDKPLPSPGPFSPSRANACPRPSPPCTLGCTPCCANRRASSC